MSKLHSNTTADYIEWDTMLNLVRKLYKDENYRMSLLIACRCFFGLRISDIKRLTWRMLTDNENFSIVEKKTSKYREVRINEGLKAHIKDCFIKNKDELCFVNRYGNPISIQMINKHLKSIKYKYNLKIEHFSSHSFRKTFGRKVVDGAGAQSEMALIKLSEIFNHSSPAITRRYLGFRADELEEIYNLLDF